MKPNKILSQHKARLLREEKRLLQRRESSYWKETLAPVKEKLSDLIPDKALGVLREAFETGFYVVFDKGTAIIEKSYSAQKHRDQYDVNRYILGKAITKKNLKRFDRHASKNAAANKGISAAEGAVLGVLGIGLPDIPVFIGVILRTVYEICLSYGFEYDAPQERIFILGIICTASSKGDARAEHSARTDRIGYLIDTGQAVPDDLKGSIREAADCLSGALLGAKFLQGFALVGAVGGITNLSLIQSVSRIAIFKYKKRFLRRAISAGETEK
ncbi:EcsC family protein [Papillibacter cinnamivorans]|uniref:EcsC protein family protein n=1 Tax=Papillibacter cinnamivorans DSM 12816 TaxID=1122930 RepID=A0A1W2A5Y1_9FIRM|nr:EcsC family protein [Papillibacter cinnamivorans]SMC55973.1 EcsC protein family protein [Papillibacter cinnamivorans DSM 12816]